MSDVNETQAGDSQVRKIVAGLFASLDGIVDAPERWGFPYMTQAMSAQIMEGIANADAVLLGSRTYALFEQLWKHQMDSVPMARFLNGSPKFVVSKAPVPLGWAPATRLDSHHLLAELDKLRSRPGKNIQIPGSPRLVRSLVNQGLLDEISLMICPVIVGSGFRLFEANSAPLSLELIALKRFDNGVISVTYRPQTTKADTQAAQSHFPKAASGK